MARADLKPELHGALLHGSRWHSSSKGSTPAGQADAKEERRRSSGKPDKERPSQQSKKGGAEMGRRMTEKYWDSMAKTYDKEVR